MGRLVLHGGDGGNGLIFTASAADDLAAQGSDELYRGHLVWGHEVRTFTECGSRREGWVLDRTDGDLVQVYRSLIREPYGPLFVEVRGRWGRPPAEGFGAEFDEQLELLELRRAAREGPGCEQDLAGIDYVARGNEPFWQVEIRSTGMLLSVLGRFDRLEFPSPTRTSTPGAETFAAERDGESPQRIEVRITERRCIDSMSGSVFAYAATARVDGTTLAGCAQAGS
jgi:putative lipoprotein